MLRRLGIALAALFGVRPARRPGRVRLRADRRRPERSSPRWRPPAEHAGAAGRAGRPERSVAVRLSQLAALRLRDRAGRLARGRRRPAGGVGHAHSSKGEVAGRAGGCAAGRPASAAAAAPPPQPEPPFSLPKLPELPDSLPHVAIDRLFVDALGARPTGAGRGGRFALDGNATTGMDGRRAQAELALHRTDQPTAELTPDRRPGHRRAESEHRCHRQRDRWPAGCRQRSARGRGTALSLTGQGPLVELAG